MVDCPDLNHIPGALLFMSWAALFMRTSADKGCSTPRPGIPPMFCKVGAPSAASCKIMAAVSYNVRQGQYTTAVSAKLRPSLFVSLSFFGFM